jgi:hypothetical protein
MSRELLLRVTNANIAITQQIRGISVGTVGALPEYFAS